jgi:outer membrane protein assembly factor BamD
MVLAAPQKCIWLLVVLILFLGCAGSPEVRAPETDDYYFNKAMAFYRKGDYWQAKPVFTEIRDKFPLSRYAVLSELRLADIHYFNAEYVEAIHFYEEFKRLHPSHPDVPYAIFQLGMCYFKQRASIDRDQTPVEKASRHFEYLITHYPSSPFTGKAMGKYKICRQMMFEHDFYIAHFYYKTKEYWAAKKRLLKMIPKYPYIRGKDSVLLYLAKTYQHLNEEGEAKKTLVLLRNDYPESEYTDEVERLLDRSPDGEEKKNGN